MNNQKKILALKIFLVLALLIVLMNVSAENFSVQALESLWSGSNAVSIGMSSLVNSINADGSTIGNYAYANDNKWASGAESWIFTLVNSSVDAGTINSATLYLKHYQSGYIDDNFNIDVYDGTTWTTVQSYVSGTPPPTTDTTNSWNVSTILNTWTKIDVAQVRIIGNGKSAGDDAPIWYVDTVELRIDHTLADTIPPASVTGLANQSAGLDWIYWNWTGPSDSDFNSSIIYLDGNNLVNTPNNYYNATGLNSGTSYVITVHTQDNYGNVNNTDINSTATTLSVGCTENWVIQYTVCNTSDQRIKYYTDSNNCGTINNLPGDNGTVETCDYCVYNNINTTWTDWFNQTGCQANDTILQNRSKTEYDSNYSTCYAVTGLASDLWNSGNNNTYWEFNITTCDYCTPSLTNTSWTTWINLTCAVDQMNQSRSKTQYDQNYCGEVSNTTYYEYQLVGPSYQNTTWTSWINLSCLSSDTMNESRNLTQYDTYNCAVNITHFEYQNVSFCEYCTPNLINTSWNLWTNLTSCLANDTIQQVRNLTQYDQNNCGEISNTTHYEYQNIVCDYCTPSLVNTSWSTWLNISCLSGDVMNQTRNKTQYDQNSCDEVTNQTFVKYRATESCDYCTLNIVNTSWTSWYNTSDCYVNDTIDQARNKTQYDQNYCGEVSNTTYFEYQSENCTYIAPPNPPLENSGGSGSSSSTPIVESEICEEKWSCLDWEDCVDGKQIRTCYSNNECGTIDLKPNEIQECNIICEENWTCEEWGSCESNYQLRLCQDINGCNTLNTKPKEKQECSIETVPIEKSWITGKVVASPFYLLDSKFIVPIILLLMILSISLILKTIKLSKHMRELLLVFQASVIITASGLFFIILALLLNLSDTSLIFVNELGVILKIISLIILGLFVLLYFGKIYSFKKITKKSKKITKKRKKHDKK